MKKSENGITLVALVVTIIILLIISRIGITALTQTRLLEKTKEAKEITQNAQLDENNKLTDYTNNIETYISSSSRENINNQYSLDEKEIGTWINGKKLYRKIIQGTLNYTITQSFEHNVNNLETGLLTGSYLKAGNGNTYTLFLDSHLVESYVDSTNIYIKKSSASNYHDCKIYFILEYTKNWLKKYV